MKKDVKVTILNWVINIVITITFVYFSMRGIDDLTSAYKIDDTKKNIKEIRLALEEYYQLTGTYPELTKKGANEDLTILDYMNEKGELISFAKIYGRKTIEKTQVYKDILSSNEIYDVKDFKNITKNGGWNYNFTEKTGEIYPNLPEEIYGEKINWRKQ